MKSNVQMQGTPREEVMELVEGRPREEVMKLVKKIVSSKLDMLMLLILPTILISNKTLKTIKAINGRFFIFNHTLLTS